MSSPIHSDASPRTDRESMPYDVVIVGGGPAGMAAAIRLKQLAQAAGREISVCVLEKGSEVGAHTLSGAVIETRALDELLPNWRERGSPIVTAAAEDRFLFLTKSRALKMPTPPQMNNHGNYIVSLGLVVRWLGQQAEALGVEIYPGFAAAEILYGEQGEVVGVATGDMGLAKDGSRTSNFQPGVELRARFTLFAEGCRGSLSKRLMARFNLTDESQPQTYGIGIKELWQIDPAKHRPGSITHTIGWPLTSDTYGGSFLYHLENNQVAVGFVIGLDYKNPHLSPFNEFQRFKQHPAIRPVFEGGRRISYGARAINEGGWQSIPRLSFPGGAMIGCAAGFLNVPKIKGSHTAMKSGMIAAELLNAAIANPQQPGSNELAGYREAIDQSWIAEELRKVRNIRPGFRWGSWFGLIHAAVTTYILRGKEPWTLKHHRDNEGLKRHDASRAIDYPKPDGVLSFDRNSSVFLSGTNHAENQPVHLQLKDASVPIAINWKQYRSPEQHYCPAGVYEIIGEGDSRALQINAQNCVHCKTCDIKDPTQNINWVVPQGGDGPNYPNM
ncbi:MAG: electron transfer flavoprotein-ubiquinone oxidoreductase [Alphaproteobacteria bacterium]|nr:electron transfer flavoprotein-ubiquinone oxidoreductase [Alphaproteobacteria bacterium]